MKAILLNEWKNLIRNKQLLVAITLFFTVGLYAIYYGHSEVKKQQNTIAVVLEKEQESINKAKESFKEPSFKTSWGVRRTLANAPSPLTALSLGQRDVFPYTKTVRTYGLYGTMFSSEIANPYKLLTGNFDLAFVFIFLLPLLLIALSYNLLSAEKENGTLALILVNHISLKQLIFTKITFRFLLILGFVILLFFVGLLATDTPMNSHAFSWLIAIIAYTVFWACVIFYWISWQKNSAFNALILLGTWLFFVVLIPTFLNMYLESTKPVVSGANLQRELREITEKGWAVSKKENLTKFFAEKGKVDTTKIDAGIVHEVALIYYMDKTAKPHFDEYKQQLAEQVKTSHSLSWLSPAIQTQTALNQIANADADAYLSFLENSESYYEDLKAFFDTQKLNNNKFQKTDFDKIPKPEITASVGLIDLAGFIKISAWGLMFLLLGWMKLGRV